MDEKVEAKVSKFSFANLLGGKSTKERLENWSFLIIVISGIMISMGIGLGSFVQGTILMASFGSFFFLIGVIVFLASQFLEEAS